MFRRQKVRQNNMDTRKLIPVLNLTLEAPIIASILWKIEARGYNFIEDLLIVLFV